MSAETKLLATLGIIGGLYFGSEYAEVIQHYIAQIAHNIDYAKARVR